MPKDRNMPCVLTRRRAGTSTSAAAAATSVLVLLLVLLCRFSSEAFTLTFSTTFSHGNHRLPAPTSGAKAKAKAKSKSNYVRALSVMKDGDGDSVGGFGDDGDLKDNFEGNKSNNDKDGKSEKDEYSLGDAEMKWIQGRTGTVIDTEETQQQPRGPDGTGGGAENKDFTEYTDEDGAGNVNIPKTGVSVSDEMVALQSDETFLTQLVPLVDDQVPKGVRAARIDTVVDEQIGDEPARYLVPLDRHGAGDGGAPMRYAMVDIPPYSDELADRIRSYLSPSPSPNPKDDGEHTLQSSSPTTKPPTGILSDILITSVDGIHYDESPAVYVTPRSDLGAWKQAFPEAHIIIYRLDAPRECKVLVDQVLDGYGPWAATGDGREAQTAEEPGANDPPPRFVETGRPLTRMEWSEEVQEQVLDRGLPPPDDDDDDVRNSDAEGLYTPSSIKSRERHRPILAVYTPGHTYGSVSYVFPNVGVCCSGFTLPLEDTRPDAAMGSTMPGPSMDYRGYITTNRGGMGRQIESARRLIDVYGDRFRAVLPSRGSPVCLQGDDDVEVDGAEGGGGDSQKNVEYRARVWNRLLNDYAELGRVYEQLGII